MGQDLEDGIGFMGQQLQGESNHKNLGDHHQEGKVMASK